MGAHGITDADRLIHHLRVHAQAPGGVDDDDVVAVGASLLHTAAGDRDGVAHPIAGFGRPHVDSGALSNDAQLGDGVGALQVGGDQQNASALLAQPAAELAGQRRLAGALEAGEHDDRGTPVGPVDLAGLPAEDFDELVIDDLDDLLGGVEGLGAGGLLGLLTHRRGEGADHRQSDVGLQEGPTDLRNSGVDIRLGQAALAAQRAE